jgi:hypothetical protein
MPLKRPRRLDGLRLAETSLVDKGANQHARVVLCKRFDPDAVAKGPGADAFDAALGVREAMEQVGAFRDAVWEVLDALSSAVCRISDDDGVSDKAAAIKEAVDAAMARLPAEAAEEAAEGDGDATDVGKAADPPEPGDGRAAMGPAKRKLGGHLATLKDKLKGAKHAGHVAAALGGFYRNTAGVLAQMPPAPGAPAAADPEQTTKSSGGPPGVSPPHPAGDGVAKGAGSPPALSISAAGDGAAKGNSALSTTDAGGAAGNAAQIDTTDLQKRLDDQAAESEALRKRHEDVEKRLGEQIEKAEWLEFVDVAKSEQFRDAHGSVDDRARFLRFIRKNAPEAERKFAEDLLRADAGKGRDLSQAFGKSGSPARFGSAIAEYQERVAKVQAEHPDWNGQKVVSAIKADTAFFKRYEEETGRHDR